MPWNDTSTGTVWYTWVDGTTTATSSTASTSSITWNQWNSTSNVTASSATDVIWSYWATNATTATSTTNYYRPSPRDLEAQRRQDEEYRRRQEELRQHRQAAETRAEDLLRSCLSSEQVAELEADNRFHVIGSGGRRYCIHRGHAGNVARDSNRFCAHAAEWLPDADHMLAQKLLLETDEEAFLAIANELHR